jgi:hypothetical protein
MAFSFLLGFPLVCAYDVTHVYAASFDILSLALRRPSLVAIPVGARLFRRIATFSGKMTCQVRWMASAERCSARDDVLHSLESEKHESNHSSSTPGAEASSGEATGASCFNPLRDALSAAGRVLFEESVKTSHRVPARRAENVGGSAPGPMRQPRPKSLDGMQRSSRGASLMQDDML